MTEVEPVAMMVFFAPIRVAPLFDVV